MYTDGVKTHSTTYIPRRAIVALSRPRSTIRRGEGGEYRRVSSSSVCARGRGATVARVVASRNEEEIDGRGEGKQRKTTHALADATNDTVRARVAKPRPRPRWTMDLNVNGARGATTTTTRLTTNATAADGR